MDTLAGKVAIVTGASQGIGKGIALAFAREGAAVAVLARTYEKVVQTAEDIQKVGGHALAIRCDVSQRAQVNDAIAATVKEFGTVDILVNNAMSERPRRFEKITDEDMQLVLGSALMGTLYCMQACFPYMKVHGGKIINFGSGAATMGLEKQGSYAAAKEGIRGMTKVAATEWGQYGINVNVVCPMATSPAYEDWLNKTASPEQRKAEMDLTPMRRMGDPERDIGRVCVFLASQDSNFITGRTLHVDGGRAYYDR